VEVPDLELVREPTSWVRPLVVVVAVPAGHLSALGVRLRHLPW
jgi:hypothetical protein